MVYKGHSSLPQQASKGKRVWVQIQPPGYGPQVLVLGSIYQGKPFWVPISSPELVPPFCLLLWGSFCFPLPGKKYIFIFAGVLIPAKNIDPQSNVENHVMLDRQASIVQKISSVHGNVMAVGDDAQSIYAFRGLNLPKKKAWEGNKNVFPVNPAFVLLLGAKSSISLG